MAKRFCPLLAAASLAGAFLWPAEALSATITVMNADDGGPGSLRAALAAAADGDTIVFASGLSGIPILLTSGELSITKDLDIAGHGPGATILDGNASSRVISVGQDADVTLAGLTIRSGVAKIGAGILNGGRLTLENSAVEGNRCDEMNESGCGIYNSGILTVRSSTISDNSCACYPPVCHCEGAGMVNMGVANLTASIVAHNTSVVCGGIQNFSELTMVQSLVSENVAIPGEGGGLCVSGKVVLISTSVTDNYAGLQGAGISSHGDLTLDHSLVARNSTNHEGGGGIYNGGYLALLNSEISDNRANTFGGGVYNLGTMRSVGTTVSTNVGLAWAGGGIANGDYLNFSGTSSSAGISLAWTSL